MDVETSETKLKFNNVKNFVIVNIYFFLFDFH